MRVSTTGKLSKTIASCVDGFDLSKADARFESFMPRPMGLFWDTTVDATELLAALAKPPTVFVAAAMLLIASVIDGAMGCLYGPPDQQ